MSDYYRKIIIEKLKKDIISEIGTNEKIIEIITEYFKDYNLELKTEKEIFDIKENNTNIYRDRELYKNRDNLCIARVWNCGMGGQCSRNNKINGFCKMHHEKGGHDWWLGTINERRPHDPVNHNGKVHKWLN